MAAIPRMTTTLAVTFALMLFNQGGEASFPRVVDIVVPPYPERQTNVTLECKYETGTEDLYALKWYHNGKEFFRYMPGDPQPFMVFPITSIEVMENESKPNKVVLKEVDLSAAGEYKCEVNTGWPQFKHNNMTSNMTVVVIPQNQPRIDGHSSDHYSVGNWVKLNCTAAPSIPPAALVWLINDKPADKDYLHEYPIEKQEDGLMVSNLGLRFKLSKKDFIDGELKLKCTATIATLYHSSNEHSQQSLSADVNEVRERPSEGSLVTTSSNTGHMTAWASTSLRLVGLPLLVLCLCMSLLW